MGTRALPVKVKVSAEGRHLLEPLMTNVTSESVIVAQNGASLFGL